MELNEPYEWKGKTYKLVVTTSNKDIGLEGYTVSVYEEGNANASRIYTDRLFRERDLPAGV